VASTAVSIAWDAATSATELRGRSRGSAATVLKGGEKAVRQGYLCRGEGVGREPSQGHFGEASATERIGVCRACAMVAIAGSAI